MNDRLPEMIWSALLISALGRKAALKELRDFLRFVWENPDRESLHDCTLTGFANLEDSLRSAVIAYLCHQISQSKLWLHSFYLKRYQRAVLGKRSCKSKRPIRLRRWF